MGPPKQAICRISGIFGHIGGAGADSTKNATRAECKFTRRQRGGFWVVLGEIGCRAANLAENTGNTANCLFWRTHLGTSVPAISGLSGLGGPMGSPASGQAGWESLGARWVLPCGPMSSHVSSHVSSPACSPACSPDMSPAWSPDMSPDISPDMSPDMSLESPDVFTVNIAVHCPFTNPELRLRILSVR